MRKRSEYQIVFKTGMRVKDTGILLWVTQLESKITADQS